MDSKFSFPLPNLDEDHHYHHLQFESADHLFSNGKLLPHTYVHPIPISRSKSLVSSRSSSSNCSSGRSSSASSGTTPTQLAPSRNLMRTSSSSSSTNTTARRHPSQHYYYIMSAAPVGFVSRQGSGKVSRMSGVEKGSSKLDSDGQKKKRWMGKRILRGLVSACKHCHALKPAPPPRSCH